MRSPATPIAGVESANSDCRCGVRQLRLPMWSPPTPIADVECGNSNCRCGVRQLRLPVRSQVGVAHYGGGLWRSLLSVRQCSPGVASGNSDCRSVVRPVPRTTAAGRPSGGGGLWRSLLSARQCSPDVESGNSDCRSVVRPVPRITAADYRASSQRPPIFARQPVGVMAMRVISERQRAPRRTESADSRPSIADWRISDRRIGRPTPAIGVAGLHIGRVRHHSVSGLARRGTTY